MLATKVRALAARRLSSDTFARRSLGAAGATGAFLHDQCYGKCAACIEAGTCTAEMQCGGFLPAQDGPNSGALCLAEAECKALCTGTADCVGKIGRAHV